MNEYRIVFGTTRSPDAEHEMIFHAVSDADAQKRVASWHFQGPDGPLKWDGAYILKKFYRIEPIPFPKLSEPKFLQVA